MVAIKSPGQIGEISQLKLLDLSVLAIGMAQKVSDVGLTVVDIGDGSDMDSALVFAHAGIVFRAFKSAIPTMGNLVPTSKRVNQ